jgi:DASH complex subunit SPC19
MEWLDLTRLAWVGKGRRTIGSGKIGQRGEPKADTLLHRLKALRQKKERLGYAVERLQLQSQQRQRQLRMSVAAT